MLDKEAEKQCTSVVQSIFQDTKYAVSTSGTC